jgi:orotate phosphoribosyltransferase
VEAIIDILKELDEAGAILLDRHFVYKSKKHGPGYINMDSLFPNAVLTMQICGMLAEPFDGEFDTVAAPAVGGVALSVLAAVSASFRGTRIYAVWADKTGDGFAFERAGFADHLTGKRVMVVEDLLTTGGSVMKVCREAEKHGAQLVGVSVICNRGSVTAEQLGVPRLEALTSINLEAVEASECELCRNEVPIVEDVGHGSQYKAQRPDYSGGYVKLLA